MSDERMTEVRACEHCGNRAPMPVVASYEQDTSECDLDSETAGFRSTVIFDVVLCPSCEKIILLETEWNELMMPGDTSVSALYPEAIGSPSGLPEAIERAYESARRVRSVEANAYGVLIGRLLELVCKDQKAEGKNLFSKLNDLASKGVIPEKLSGIAQGLREFRNIGAHAELGELTESQVPLLEKLVRAILEYVYTAPFLARQAEHHLAQLKGAEPE